MILRIIFLLLLLSCTFADDYEEGGDEYPPPPPILDITPHIIDQNQDHLIAKLKDGVILWCQGNEIKYTIAIENSHAIVTAYNTTYRRVIVVYIAPIRVDGDNLYVDGLNSIGLSGTSASYWAPSSFIINSDFTGLVYDNRRSSSPFRLKMVYSMTSKDDSPEEYERIMSLSNLELVNKGEKDGT